ncbi:hypothetical protein B7G60_15090, partial [Staphylococcus aureus]
GALTQYDLDEYSPLLYATAGVKLPFTGMSAKAEAVYSHWCRLKQSGWYGEKPECRCSNPVRSRRIQSSALRNSRCQTAIHRDERQS